MDGAKSDLVVLKRDELFEFFGAVALPPWTLETGEIVGGSVDCAPIAPRISEWVESHEVTLPGVISSPSETPCRKLRLSSCLGGQWCPFDCEYCHDTDCTCPNCADR